MLFLLTLLFLSLTQVLSLTPSDLTPLIPLLSPQAEIHFPSSPSYPPLTSRFTTLGSPLASAVVLISTEHDILETLSFTRTHNISIFIQNRGHAWNTALERNQNVLFINISRLRKITLSPDATTARVSGGANISAVMHALQERGKQMTVPSCDCVGIAGPTLGGGVGRLMGNYGLMLDNVKEMRVAMYDGRILSVSANKHPDLFWGMRGAGHQFGVVTEITYKVHSSPTKNLHYNLDMIFGREELRFVFEWARRYHLGNGLPVGLSMTFIYSNTVNAEGVPEPFFLVNYVYAGDPGFGRRFAEPIYKRAKRIVLEKQLIWTDLPSVGGLGAASALCPKGERYSMWSADSKKLDPSTQLEIFDLYNDMLLAFPDARGSALLFQAHSQKKSQSIDVRTTAFANRAANLFSVMTLKYTDPGLDGEMEKFGRKLRGLLRESSGFRKPHVYMNYAWGDEDLQTKYGYEPWRLAKLRGLKRRYDPEGRFNGYHPFE